MDMSKLQPISIESLKKHSKTLYRSLCVPSTAQSYSLCIEFAKRWFLSKFPRDFFKSIYVDCTNIFDNFRKLSRQELLKIQKPALAITPSFSWDFNNEQIDTYPYGLDMYTTAGRAKESFFSCHETKSYLGIRMELLLMQ